MAGRVANLVAVWLAFAAGVAAGSLGTALLVLSRDMRSAAVLVAGGLGLLAWVLFHPARVDELEHRADKS